MEHEIRLELTKILHARLPGKNPILKINMLYEAVTRRREKINILKCIL